MRFVGVSAAAVVWESGGARMRSGMQRGGLGRPKGLGSREFGYRSTPCDPVAVVAEFLWISCASWVRLLALHSGLLRPPPAPPPARWMRFRVRWRSRPARPDRLRPWPLGSWPCSSLRRSALAFDVHPQSSELPSSVQREIPIFIDIDPNWRFPRDNFHAFNCSWPGSDCEECERPQRGKCSAATAEVAIFR